MCCLVHGWYNGQGHGGDDEYPGQGYCGGGLGSGVWVVYLIKLPTELALVGYNLVWVKSGNCIWTLRNSY